jgi:pilus assembly protein Flp/PilA
MKLTNFLVTFLRDERGQDMVEYALLTGFVAVAAGATIPDISTQINTIFSRMTSLTDKAGA